MAKELAKDKKLTLAQRNVKIVELATALLKQLDTDQFEMMCKNGQKQVLEAAELLGIETEKFAPCVEIHISVETLIYEFDAKYRGQCLTNPKDWKITGTMVHTPTGEEFELCDDIIEDIYHN